MMCKYLTLKIHMHRMELEETCNESHVIEVRPILHRKKFLLYFFKVY